MSMGKICTKCLVEKEESKYYKHKNGKNGLNPVCKVCWKKSNKIYEKSNPRKEYRKKRYETKKPQILRKVVEYRKTKYKNDINFKLQHNIRSRINNALRGHVKSCRTKDLIGVDIKEYKKYLSSKFKEGMNWENWGEWEIDHIRPCSSFNLLDPKEQKKCFIYTNTQPLWKDENRKKSNKVI